MLGLDEYREVTYELQSSRGEFQQKRHETRDGRRGEEYEGGRQKWGYVKVTMHGWVCGRTQSLCS